MDSRLRLSIKSVAAKVKVWLALFVLAYCGCDTFPAANKLPGSSDRSVYADYGPARLDIMPLTEFAAAGDAEVVSGIKIYVSVLDEFGCQVKSPCVFRFELYEYVERSARPRGRRIAIWPDVDLTDAGENNRYWQDFLRTYRFDLDFEPQPGQRYVLQVTSLCPDGRRVSADFELEH